MRAPAHDARTVARHDRRAPHALARFAAVAAMIVLTACTSPQTRDGAAGGSIPSPDLPSSPQSPPPSRARLTPSPSAAATPAPSASPTPSAPALAAHTSHGPRDRKQIALTFDADMYPWMYAERNEVSHVDERIVDLLERTDTAATVFLNGLYVKAYPDLVRRLAGNPRIELANHSWDHAGWTSDCPNTSPIAPPMTMETEVTETEAIIESVTGVRVQYFRFPGFCRTDAQVELVRSLGEYSIGSDCYFGDSLGWSAAQQVASVQEGCQQGSIVVTHLNAPPYHPDVYEALEILIPWWESNGWSVVTVGELLGHPAP